MNIPFRMAIVAALVLSGVQLCPAQSYHAFFWTKSQGMQDLGTLGGDSSYALGINDKSQVVGFSYLADNTTYHAFLWTSSGGMVDLGAPAGYAFSNAGAINAAGHIVGLSYQPPSANVAWYWTPDSGFTIIPVLGGYTGDSINKHDQVAGYANTSYGFQGFAWAPGSLPHRVGNLVRGEESICYGISDLGNITGQATTATGASHAIFAPHGGPVADIAPDLGDFSFGSGINGHDEIAGLGLNSSGTFVAFYWSEATGLFLLTPLASDDEADAYAINEHGLIAGDSDNKEAGRLPHAVLWRAPAALPIDLGTLPGDTYSSAVGINNLGEVVGVSGQP